MDEGVCWTVQMHRIEDARVVRVVEVAGRDEAEETAARWREVSAVVRGTHAVTIFPPVLQPV